MTTTQDSRFGSPRTTYLGLWLLAAVGFTALLLAGQSLAAAGLFAVAAIAAVAYERVGGVRFDERDEAVMQTASARTVQVGGLCSAVVFPSLVAANALGYYEWTPFMAGVGVTVAALYLLWAAMVGVERTRR